MNTFNRWARRCTCLWLAVQLIVLSLATATADAQILGVPSGTAGGSESLPSCPNPGVCFISAEDKQRWAEDQRCSFEETECKDTEPASGGAKATADAMLRFAEGVIDGLIQQLADIWEFFKAVFGNPSETYEALKALGKIIIEDPSGAMNAFLNLLGTDAKRFLECGAYDKGELIGTYVSPYAVLKVAKLAAKTGKKLKEVVEIVKREKVGPEGGTPRIPGSHWRPDIMLNGKSIFDEPGIKARGVAAETALGKNTPDAFKVVDRIENRTIVSDKTYNLRDNYKTDGSFTKQMRSDLRDLARFTEGESTWEKGTPHAGEQYVITESKYDKKVLEVIVQRGQMTEAQYVELQKARAYAAELYQDGTSKVPIEIVVVEVP